MPAEQLADKVLLPTKEVEGATGELAFVVTEVRLDPLDRMVSPSPDELGTLGLGSVIGAEKGLDLGQSRALGGLGCRSLRTPSALRLAWLRRH
jgi:hypothetical protein